MMKIRNKHIATSYIILLTSFATASCISPVTIEGTPCPCPEKGYVCCDDICRESCNDTDTVEPDAGDTDTDTGSEITLAELGQPCNNNTHCNEANDLVCHAWRVPDSIPQTENGSPYRCVKKCEYKNDDCNKAKKETCRSISYIRGNDPPQGQILHTTACVKEDDLIAQGNCALFRCPKLDFVPGMWTCVLDAVMINAWAIRDDCGLICWAQTVKSCGSPDLCIQDAGVGSCFDKSKLAVVPACTEKTCEEVCGSWENRGRYYCDGKIHRLCWAGQYENNVDECPDMCFDQAFPKDTCE